MIQKACQPRSEDLLSPQIEAWFTRFPPTPEKQARQEALRNAAKQMAYAIMENTSPGPDQSAAYRLLRECVLTANDAIAMEVIFGGRTDF